MGVIDYSRSLQRVSLGQKIWSRFHLPDVPPSTFGLFQMFGMDVGAPSGEITDAYGFSASENWALNIYDLLAVDASKPVLFDETDSPIAIIANVPTDPKILQTNLSNVFRSYRGFSARRALQIFLSDALGISVVQRRNTTEADPGFLSFRLGRSASSPFVLEQPGNNLIVYLPTGAAIPAPLTVGGADTFTVAMVSPTAFTLTYNGTNWDLSGVVAGDIINLAGVSSKVDGVYRIELVSDAGNFIALSSTDYDTPTVASSGVTFAIYEHDTTFTSADVLTAINNLLSGWTVGHIFPTGAAGNIASADLAIGGGNGIGTEERIQFGYYLYGIVSNNDAVNAIGTAAWFDLIYGGV